MTVRRGAAVAAAAFGLALGAASARGAEATASHDLDGDGGIETIAAKGRGRKVDVTVTDASGRRLARARVPSPRAGVESVALRIGDLGSTGALLEVEASGNGAICRSIWRLRESELDRVALRTGAGVLPDCDEEGWSARWERPEPGAPPVYRREREREISGRRHAQTHTFAFTGFALELDPGRGFAAIDGVAIPSWPRGEMLPTDALDRLREAFDYESVRSAPRLFLDANREAGTFQVRLRDAGGEVLLPVRSTMDSPGGIRRLEASQGESTAVVSVLVRDGLPIEATVTGMTDRFDRIYLAVSRRRDDRIVIYPGPEEDIAREILPGLWSGLSGSRMTIRPASEGPGRVEMDGRSYRVALRGAPKGTDVLLLPAQGGGQAWALDLRTVDGIARLPVQCAAPDAADPGCEAGGAMSELYRRVGARLNR